MVSALSIVFICITLVFSLLLPIIILIFLQKKFDDVFDIWAAGMLGFILAQLLVRVPALQILGTLPAFREFTESRPTLYVFSLALSAGLLETTGRLLILKIVLGKKRRFATGLAAGAGHGGIESIVLVGLVYVNNLVISLHINAGRLESLIPDNPVLAESIRQALINTPPELFLISGFERIFTMIIHIALSLVLVMFMARRQYAAGFLLVAASHSAIDFIIGYLQLSQISPWIIEAVILGMALAAIYAITRIRKVLPAASD